MYHKKNLTNEKVVVECKKKVKHKNKKQRDKPFQTKNLLLLLTHINFGVLEPFIEKMINYLIIIVIDFSFIKYFLEK